MAASGSSSQPRKVVLCCNTDNPFVTVKRTYNVHMYEKKNKNDAREWLESELAEIPPGVNIGFNPDDVVGYVMCL